MPNKTYTCRSCGAQIVWVKTNSGKNMPVDASTCPDGATSFDPGAMRSHFATCSFASSHRAPRKKDRRDEEFEEAMEEVFGGK